MVARVPNDVTPKGQPRVLRRPRRARCLGSLTSTIHSPALPSATQANASHSYISSSLHRQHPFPHHATHPALPLQRPFDHHESTTQHLAIRRKYLRAQNHIHHASLVLQRDEHRAPRRRRTLPAQWLARLLPYTRIFTALDADKAGTLNATRLPGLAVPAGRWQQMDDGNIEGYLEPRADKRGKSYIAVIATSMVTNITQLHTVN